MVTCPEWIGGVGEGSYINCMHGGSVPDEVINSYCWIKGTFSVPKHYRDFDTEGLGRVTDWGWTIQSQDRLY